MREKEQEKIYTSFSQGQHFLLDYTLHFLLNCPRNLRTAASDDGWSSVRMIRENQATLMSDVVLIFSLVRNQTVLVGILQL